MKIRILFFLLSIAFSFPSRAITCYFTLAKDSCWINYNVSVDVIDSLTETILTTISVPKGKAWTRQTFDCKPAQSLRYVARFTPVFWEKDVGKTYNAIRSWSLPEKINPGDVAWNVSVCYAKDFSLVPFPPDASGNCSCDFDSIPKIKVS
ncbi:MAG: hypothetical protein PSV35_05635 [bacterium]|nr:hypothetical protein [bacterium]